MIYLITGKPGQGKSALGLVRAIKYRDEGRLVYAHGVPKLDYDKIGFKRLDDPTQWQDLPDGSVVLIDECYSTFPSRAPGKAVPPHVEAMARHRHRGFDFILLAQQGLQLDSFLRGLVEEHAHLNKRWGSRATRVKRWTEYQGNTKAACMDTEDWVRPKSVFQYFESTTMDTSKVRIPRWAFILGALVLAVVLGSYYAKHRLDARVAEYKAEAEGPDASARLWSAGASGRSGPRAIPTDAAGYLAMFEPRVPSNPASAPIYDGRQVVQYPKAFCIAVGEAPQQTCRCYTQQATRVNMDLDVCLRVVRDGPEFDPYAEPLQARASDRSATALAPDASDAISHNGALRPPSGPVDPVAASKLTPSVWGSGNFRAPQLVP